MNQPPQLQVPSPPKTQEVVGHYFIYGEWTAVKEGKKIAVSLNSKPEPDQLVKVGMNEAIAMHPAVYTVLIQNARPGYSVKAWSGISKELFDWYKDVEERKKAAIAAMQNGKTG